MEAATTDVTKANMSRSPNLSQGVRDQPSACIPSGFAPSQDRDQSFINASEESFGVPQGGQSELTYSHNVQTCAAASWRLTNRRAAKIVIRLAPTMPQARLLAMRPQASHCAAISTNCVARTPNPVANGSIVCSRCPECRTATTSPLNLAPDSHAR